MPEVKCPKCESMIQLPKVAFRGEAVRCLECDFPITVQLPTYKLGYLERRRPLKRFVLSCSVGYFVFVLLLVAIEMAKGIPTKPHPENFGATVLAVAGLIWATREDKPKGE